MEKIKTEQRNTETSGSLITVVYFSWGIFGINMAYASSHSSLLVYSAVYNILHVIQAILKLKLAGGGRSVELSRSTQKRLQYQTFSWVTCCGREFDTKNGWRENAWPLLIDLKLINSKKRKKKNSTMLKDNMGTTSNHKWDYETGRKKLIKC